MIERIKELEKISRLLSPSPEQKENWNAQVLQYSANFLKNIEQDKAYYHSEEKGKGIYKFDISEEPTEIDSLIKAVEGNIDRVGINPASGGYLGYIPGGGIYPSALGDYMAAVSNRYAGVFYAAPGAVRLENMLLRWMCRLMGFPENSAGNLTSGGSIANLIAIVTAREAQNLKARDFERAVIYLSEQAHHSIQKAIRIAGLSEAVLRYVPMDENLKISANELEKTIIDDRKKGLIPFFIIASVGTTNTGAVDPINDIADIAEKYGLWFHIDAAYGGFFKLVPQMRDKFVGVERADSIILDPHKSLFLPFGTGAVLIKQKEALLEVHHYLADYMQDTRAENEEISPADISPELTKHFRGMRLWLPLKLFGLKPFRAALEEKIYLARYFHREIQKIEGFEVGPAPQLSVSMFRYIPAKGDANSFNKKLLEDIQKDGRIFLSSTSINGVFWIRVAVLVYRAHLAQIQLLLEILKRKKDSSGL
ncbi:pyridoxal phosphate-dependent decarboxylase family protein [Christiangramia crocea]|uniref:Aminotransferase class V-fold PLP-dependent enzyme n=1 Tax=Christiangramia crocea TaxID=2904124 RepID=A0A9X2A7L4_9FLAO|nr:aminotransferase class V-fold PLP-dependent enzyme [Gramella crocea]MCG9970923.1 aminotransferase class V-fold PLP-dependent enzyme [Gramella crocea]